MSIVNLNFLKYKPGQCMTKCDLYAKMCDTDDSIPELEEMPIKDILFRISQVFSDWKCADNYEYRNKEGKGFFIGMVDNMMCFECEEMEKDDIDRIVNLMLEFGFPPYDIRIE